jgi:hypothetical protein
MNIQCPKNKKDFIQHMKDKIITWAPFSLHIGSDFAVFEFNWPYQMNSAINNFKHYAEYYGYRYSTDSKERMVVINTATEEETVG